MPDGVLNGRSCLASRSLINTPVSENAQDLYASRGRRAPLRHVRVDDRLAMIDERPTLTEGIEEYAFRAKEKLEAQDYAGAAAEGDRALDILPNLAEISMTRGLALLRPVVNRVMNGDGSEHVCRQDFKGAYDAFRLALVMDPQNSEAQRELERLTELMKRVPDWEPQKFVDIVEQLDEQNSHDHAHAEPGADASAEPHAMLDVIIIGAGAAGILCGLGDSG